MSRLLSGSAGLVGVFRREGSRPSALTTGPPTLGMSTTAPSMPPNRIVLPPIEKTARPTAPRTSGCVPDAALGWHVMMRLHDDRVIARTPGERRVIAQTLFARGKARDLLAFRTADTHIHALLTCSRPEAARFARYAGSCMRRRLALPVGFQTHFRPVLDQRHLYNAFRYVLRQEERHGVTLDPTHDGSSLLDLLGLRVIAPWSIQNVRTMLPRIQSAELHDVLGVDLRMAPDAPDTPGRPGTPNTPGTPGELGASGRLDRLGESAAVGALDHLGESAAAAIGVTELARGGLLVISARAAATHIARAAGLRQRRVADLLQLDERTVRRLESWPVDAAITRAILLQLRLRAALWAPPLNGEAHVPHLLGPMPLGAWGETS